MPAEATVKAAGIPLSQDTFSKEQLTESPNNVARAPRSVKHPITARIFATVSSTLAFLLGLLDG